MFDWLSNLGTSMGDLFKDGSWLKTAFSGDNFSKTMGAGSAAFDAYSKFNAANAQEKFQDKLFGLQEQQYKNSLKDQEEEKKRRDKVDNSLASVWG